MITLPELAAGALGSFLARDMKDRFGWRLNASGIAMPSTTTSSIRCSSLWPATISSRVAHY
jgi:hypothetical protein